MYKADDELVLKKGRLSRDIIGEIAMAAEPCKTIKKWRNLFRISQKDLSEMLLRAGQWST